VRNNGLKELDLPEPADNVTRPAQFRHRRSRGGSRNERKLRRLQLACVAALAACLFALLVLGMLLARANGEREQLLFELRRVERDLAAASAELERVHAERAALVEQRLPDLAPLEYDRTIDVDEAYVRNISFTLVRRAEESSHEFRLVLSNDTLNRVAPRVEVLLFDALGVQVGRAQVEMDGEGENGALEPGEVRSYSGTVDLDRDIAPRYFLLDID